MTTEENKEGISYFWCINGHYILSFPHNWDTLCQNHWSLNLFTLHQRLCLSFCVFVRVFQSSTQEFYLISSTLSRLGLELQALFPAIQSQIGSALLRGLLLDTPDLLAPAHGFLKVLNEKAAKWVSSSNWLFCMSSGTKKSTKKSLECNTKTGMLSLPRNIYRKNLLGLTFSFKSQRRIFCTQNSTDLLLK